MPSSTTMWSALRIFSDNAAGGSSDHRCEGHQHRRPLCAQSRGVAEDAKQYYYYYYYYLSGDFTCGDTQQQGWGPGMWLVAITLWTIAVIWLWTILFSPVRVPNLIPHWMVQYKDLLHGDCRRLWLLCRFVMSELLWIVSHHCCGCRRRMRRIAMKCRPYVVRSEIEGEDVIFPGSPGADRAQTPASTRRSLAAIQDGMQVQGGTLLPARRCRGQRLVRARRRGIKVVFNPRTQGECLFGAVKHAVKKHTGRTVSVGCLRRYLRDLLVNEDEEKIRGCAAKFGHTVSSYISSTVLGRWGTSLDLELLANAFDMPMVLIDCEQGKLLFDGATGRKPTVLCYRHKHFTVGKVSEKVMTAVKRRAQGGFRRGGGGNGHDQRPDTYQEGRVRRYPFAKTNLGATAASSSAPPTTSTPSKTATKTRVGCKLEEHQSSPHIALVFHGSFAPFHLGHYHTALSAVRFFEHRNVKVDSVHIGFTTDKQLRRKLGENPFTKEDYRPSVARSVLKDMGDRIMQVDANPVGAASDLEHRHVDSAKKRCIHIMGSDLQKRPSDSSIIVLRTFDDIAGNHEYLDVRTWRAVCAQVGYVGLSATEVRAGLEQGNIHESYGPAAKAVLQDRIRVPPQDRAEREEEGTPAPPQPKSKAMPRRRPKVKCEPRPQGVVLRPAVCATPQLVEAPQQPQQPLQATETGGTPEGGQITTSTLTPLELEIVTRTTKAVGGAKIIASVPKDLSFPGVLKMAGPRVLNLSTYWEHCVTPLGQLLRITPFSVTRRSGDGSVRLAYVPSQPPFVPTTTFSTAARYQDLCDLLDTMGRTVIPFQYLPFFLCGVSGSDMDTETYRGLSVKKMISETVIYADRHCLLARIRSAILVSDLTCLVVLASPLYSIGALDLAREIATLLNGRLHHYRSAEGVDPLQHTLCFAIDEASCGSYEVQGGSHILHVSEKANLWIDMVRYRSELDWSSSWSTRLTMHSPSQGQEMWRSPMSTTSQCQVWTEVFSLCKFSHGQEAGRSTLCTTSPCQKMLSWRRVLFEGDKWKMSSSPLAGIIFVAGGAPKARRTWGFVAGTTAAQEEGQLVQNNFEESGEGYASPSRHTLINCQDLAIMLADFDLLDSEAGDSSDATPITGVPLTGADLESDDEGDQDDFGDVVRRQTASAHAVLNNLRLEELRAQLAAHMSGEPALYEAVNQVRYGFGAGDLQLHALNNAGELAALIEDHDDEIFTPDVRPPPRNLEDSPDPYAQAANLYEVMALREAIRNRWPRMCHWMQVGRSPMTENDLAIPYARCVHTDAPTWHMWGHPGTVRRLEYEYVFDRLAARHQRTPRMRHHVGLEAFHLNIPPHHDRDIELEQIRLRLHALAGQAPEYDDVLDEVGLGGYEHIEGGSTLICARTTLTWRTSSGQGAWLDWQSSALEMFVWLTKLCLALTRAPTSVAPLRLLSCSGEVLRTGWLKKLSLRFGRMISPTVFVCGGAVALRAATRPTPLDPYANERTVFEPAATVADSIAACWQWLVVQETGKSLSFWHLRVVAEMWAISAVKHHYLVAGVSFHDLAAPLNVTAREYVNIYWNPDHTRSPPVLLSFVLGCVFSINAAVVDEENVRPDGLWVASKWRIRLRQGRWRVCKQFVADPVPLVNLEISQTVPWELTSSSESETEMRESWLEAEDVSQEEGPSDRLVEEGDGSNTGMVQGGALAGPFARRSFRKGQLTSSLLGIHRNITIMVNKGADLVIPFTDVISTREILERCAKAKHVGIDYLILHWLRESGKRSFQNHTLEHETRTWEGQTLVVENRRHAIIRKDLGPTEAEYERDHSSLDLAFAQRHSGVRQRKRARRNLTQAMIRLDPIREAHGEEEESQEEEEQAEDDLPLLQLVQHSASASSSSSCCVGDAPLQILKFEIRGELIVPLSWTDKEVCSFSAKKFNAKERNVAVYQSATALSMHRLLRVDEAQFQANDAVQGGGKHQRVGQQSLEAVVIAKLKQDVLISPDLAKMEGRLVEFLTRNDSKLTRAAFQAKSIPQRLEALAAACQRAGLGDIETQSRHAAEAHRRQLRAANIEEGVPSTPPDSPPPGEAGPSAQMGTEGGPNIEALSATLREIASRVKALEIWAHAADASNEELPPQEATFHALEKVMATRLREVAQEEVKEYFELQSRKAIEKAIAALPLTQQGLVLEHHKVRSLLEKDFLAGQDVLAANTSPQLYGALARAFNRDGQRRIALGMQKAADQFEDGSGSSAQAETGGIQEDGLEAAIWTTLTEAEMDDMQVDSSQALQDPQCSQTQATTDPYLTSGTRKRGRPAGTAKKENDTIQVEVAKIRSRVESTIAALTELGKRVQGEMQRTSAIEEAVRVKSSVDPARGDGLSRTSSDLASKVDKLDEWLAELGSDNLKSTALLHQTRKAIGLNETDLQNEGEDEGCQKVDIPLALQLIESRILRIEGQGEQRVQMESGTEGIQGLSVRIEACERKMINLGESINRVARTFQVMWNNLQGVGPRLQAAQDTAALALQHVHAVRAMLAPSLL
eukprot:5190162-Amphidinium_carterae.1